MRGRGQSCRTPRAITRPGASALISGFDSTMQPSPMSFVPTALLLKSDTRSSSLQTGNLFSRCTPPLRLLTPFNATSASSCVRGCVSRHPYRTHVVRGCLQIGLGDTVSAVESSPITVGLWHHVAGTFDGMKQESPEVHPSCSFAEPTACTPASCTGILERAAPRAALPRRHSGSDCSRELFPSAEALRRW